MKGKINYVYYNNNSFQLEDVKLNSISREILNNKKILLITKKFNINMLVDLFKEVAGDSEFALNYIKKYLTIRKKFSTVPNGLDFDHLLVSDSYSVNDLRDLLNTGTNPLIKTYLKYTGE